MEFMRRSCLNQPPALWLDLKQPRNTLSWARATFSRTPHPPPPHSLTLSSNLMPTLQCTCYKFDTLSRCSACSKKYIWIAELPPCFFLNLRCAKERSCNCLWLFFPMSNNCWIPKRVPASENGAHFHERRSTAAEANLLFLPSQTEMNFRILIWMDGIFLIFPWF